MRINIDSEIPTRIRCTDCHGRGRIRVRGNRDVLLGEFYDSGKYKECPKCNGLGFVYY
jgi:DnaJ-class molecular chaperone